jgi:hypothetical protein
MALVVWHHYSVVGDIGMYVLPVIAAALTLVYAVYKHERSPIRLFILFIELCIIWPIFVLLPLLLILKVFTGQDFFSF